MSIFNLWNPTVPDRQKQALEFVVTPGDAYGIAEGTKPFFAQAATALGVVIDILSWRAEACRSKYYTDFLGESDWRDNWQLVWKVTVIASRPISKLPRRAAPWTGLDAFDDTWRSGSDSSRAEVECLVVSDFASAAARTKVVRLIETDSTAKAMQTGHGLPHPVFGTSVVVGKFPQLHVGLGRVPPAFFIGGADYAEHIMSLCRAAKGTVHFAERKFL